MIFCRIFYTFCEHGLLTLKQNPIFKNVWKKFKQNMKLKLKSKFLKVSLRKTKLFLGETAKDEFYDISKENKCMIKNKKFYSLSRPLR